MINKTQHTALEHYKIALQYKSLKEEAKEAIEEIKLRLNLFDDENEHFIN